MGRKTNLYIPFVDVGATASNAVIVHVTHEVARVSKFPTYRAAITIGDGVNCFGNTDAPSGMFVLPPTE